MLGWAIFLLLMASIVTYYTPDEFYVPTALFLSLAFLGCGMIAGLTVNEMGLGARALIKGLIWGGAVFTLVGVAYGAGIAIPRLEPLFADKRMQEISARQIASKALVNVPLGTVILEEVAFRGVVFGLFQRQWDTRAAVLGTSLLFGLWHVLPSLSMHESHEMGGRLGQGRRGQLVAVVGTVLATGLAGIGFAMLRMVSGSVVAPMMLHWALNSFGSVASWWVGRRSRHRARAAEKAQLRHGVHPPGEEDLASPLD
ncbi:MAG: CPBP family intramembrane glutamic endopeptidase [Candidatus Nanopelagicales bacterium]